MAKSEITFGKIGGEPTAQTSTITLGASGVAYDTGVKASDTHMFYAVIPNYTDWYCFGTIENGTITNAINKIITASVLSNGNIGITPNSNTANASCKLSTI